jgi:hypothetical protein
VEKEFVNNHTRQQVSFFFSTSNNNNIKRRFYRAIGEEIIKRYFLKDQTHSEGEEERN